MAPSAPTPGKSVASRRTSHLTRHKTPIRREDTAETSFAAWWNVDALVEANNNLTPFRKQKYDALKWVNADLLLEEDGAEFMADDPFATPAPRPPSARKQSSVKRRRSSTVHGALKMSARRASIVKQRDLTLADLTPRSRRISAAHTNRPYLREASFSRSKTLVSSPNTPPFAGPFEQLTPIVEGPSRQAAESPRIRKPRPSSIKVVASPARPRPSTTTTPAPATPSKTLQRENGTPSATPRSRPRQYRVLPQDEEPKTRQESRRNSAVPPQAAPEESEDEELHRSIPGAFDYKPAHASFTEMLPNRVLDGLNNALDVKVVKPQATQRSKKEKMAALSTMIPRRGESSKTRPDAVKDSRKAHPSFDVPAIKPPEALPQPSHQPEQRQAPTVPRIPIFSRKPVSKPKTKTTYEVEVESLSLPHEEPPIFESVPKQRSSAIFASQGDEPKVDPAPLEPQILKPSPIIFEAAARSQLLEYANAGPVVSIHRMPEPLEDIFSKPKRLGDGGGKDTDPQSPELGEEAAPTTGIFTKSVSRNDALLLDNDPAPQVFRPLRAAVQPKPTKTMHVKASPKVVSKKRALDNSPSKREADTRSLKRKRLAVGMEASKIAADRSKAPEPMKMRQINVIQAPQDVKIKPRRHEQEVPVEQPPSRPKIFKVEATQRQPVVERKAPAPLLAQPIEGQDVFGSVLENSVEIGSISRLRREPVEIFESAEPRRPKEEVVVEQLPRQRSPSPLRPVPSPEPPSMHHVIPSHEAPKPTEVEQEVPDAGRLRHRRDYFQEDDFCTLTVPRSPKFILGRQRHEEEKAEKERERWSNLARRQKERNKRENTRAMPPVAARLLATLAGLQTGLEQRSQSKPLPSKEFTFVSDLRLSLETEQEHKQRFEAKRSLWEQRVLEASNSSVESTQHRAIIKSAPSERNQQPVQRAPGRSTDDYSRVPNEAKRTGSRAHSERGRAIDLLVPKQTRPIATRHDRLAF